MSDGSEAQRQRGHVISNRLLNIALQNEQRCCSSGCLENVFRDRAAFRTIAVEQGFRGAGATTDQGQFPREVKCVLHTGIHSLATCRAMDMCSIPSEKNTARAII